MQETLKKALVCEKICQVDRSGSFYIWNPYGGSPTTTVQSISGGSQGTYSVSTYTSTVDTLTITDEFVCSEHIYDFEVKMQHGDIIMSRMNEIVNSIATSVDKFVLNSICSTSGVGTLDTPVGGFTTGANVVQIFADICGKVAGYADANKGLYVVIENTDVSGVIQAFGGSGYSVADTWLNNGLMTSQMGIDIYVVRSGTFVDATIGSTTVSNAGHRLAGVKGITTYAEASGITWEEKYVTATTGKEYVGVCYVGVKAWYQKLGLTIDITIK